MLALTLVVLFALIGQSEQAVYTCDRTASCGCSKNSATVSRIVGGEVAASATWGWTVSLDINSALCAGSILSDSWVITVAHCLVGILPSQVIVYAGSTARYRGTQTRRAARLIVHSGFNPITFEDDIALIQLATPLNMSDPNVSAICLPSASSSVLALGEWPSANTSVSPSDIEP